MPTTLPLKSWNFSHFLFLVSEILLFGYLFGVCPHFLQASAGMSPYRRQLRGQPLKAHPTTFDAATLLSLWIAYLFYIYLLNFYTTKLKSVRVWKLCLIFCHIVHMQWMDLCVCVCVWGLNRIITVTILPQCQLLISNCVLFFCSGQALLVL